MCKEERLACGKPYVNVSDIIRLLISVLLQEATVVSESTLNLNSNGFEGQN